MRLTDPYTLRSVARAEKANELTIGGGAKGFRVPWGPNLRAQLWAKKNVL